MPKSTIAIIGGTGDEGSGLALRWSAAGHPIVIGSRSQQRAEDTAVDLSQQLAQQSIHDAATIEGKVNAAAAAAGDIVVLSVPYDAQKATIEQIKGACEGKLVITVVAPVRPPKVSQVWRPPGGSAAEEAMAQFGDSIRLVAAFQNVSAVHLKDLTHDVACDILVTGDDKEAKQVVIDLAAAGSMYGIDAGPLQNASVVEGLTAVLIGINIRHKVKGTGIQITNLPQRDK